MKKEEGDSIRSGDVDVLALHGTSSPQLPAAPMGCMAQRRPQQAAEGVSVCCHFTISAVLPTSLAVLLLLSSGSPFAAAADTTPAIDPPWKRVASHFAAERGDFKLVSASRVPIEELADSVDVGLAVRRDGAEVRKVLLLGSTGEELTFPELQERQLAALRARLGKLTPRLSERLKAQDATAVTSVRVTIWPAQIPQDPERPLFFSSTEEALAYRLRTRAARAAALANGRAELLTALASLGAKEIRALDGPPVVETTLSRDLVQAVAYRTDVAAVDLAMTEEEPREILHATYFYDADDDEVLEQYTGEGRHGTGIRVGVYEDSNYCGLWYENGSVPAGFSTWSGYTAADPSPAIHGCQDPDITDGDPCKVKCNNGVGYCRSGHCYKEHVTTVASKMGCIRDGERRNASELHLYYANVGSKAERLSWLADRGVTVLNDSETTGNDPNINWSVRNDYLTIAKAAGNSWSEQINCADNTICTGSYAIAALENIDWWKSDPGNEANRYWMSGSTSFIDSTSRWDAEKPDVMGDGEATLMSPMVSPQRGEWVRQYGTSFAAPMIGGMVALLQEEYPTAQVWPELVRPMILTSGLRHDVMGVSLSRNGPLDEIDGAGVPIATTLRDLLANEHYKPLTLVPGIFDASGHYLPPGASITLQPGSTVRAVLGWLYCVEGGANKLAADFDLMLVERSTGNVVDWSTSFTNSLEMIQFTNDDDQPHTFDLQLSSASFGSCNGVQREYAGLVWARTSENVGPSRLMIVTKTADTMDFTCDADCSLREAIHAANAFPGLDRISVPAGTYHLMAFGASEDANMTGDLDVLDDVEIVRDATGEVTISGATSDRVFDVREGARLLLSDVMIFFGQVSGENGGAIAVRGGSLELNNCSINYCRADRGGGIWSNGGSVTLRRTRVVGNFADTYGGGVFVNDAAVDVTDSSIEDNRANDSGGGFYNAAGFSWLRRSTIAGNEARKGGGIRNFDDLQLNNCTVSGNHADLEGGGVWNGNGATVAVDETTLKDNSSPSGTVLWTQGPFGFQRSLIEGTCVRFGLTPAYDEHNFESPGNTCGLRFEWNVTSVVDLRLSDLVPFGGQTRTHPPLPLSPALDPLFILNPIPGTCPAEDQRGATRPQDSDGDGTARCDSGSVERLIHELFFVGKNELHWLGVPAAVNYNIYRGLLTDLLTSGHAGSPDYGQCVNGLDPDLSDTSFIDTTRPPDGDGFYYLRSASTPVGETPLGWDSQGRTRWPPTKCP